MLKRIDPRQVELGMFIHKLEGRWMDHPFWRAKFLLNDNERLQKLRGSALSGVVIDTERGLDIEDEDEDGNGIEPMAQPALAGAAEAPAPPPPEPPSAAARLARRGRGKPATGLKTTGNLISAPPQTMAREFGRARDIAARSHRTVSRAFLKVRLGKGFKTSMVEPVIDDILGSVERNAHAFNGLMQCREDNQSLYHHALATSALMIALARQLRLPPEQLRHAGLAGLMLDVGINRLPVDLALIDHDLARIPADIFATHVDLGHDLCLEAEVPDAVATAVLEHHERTDGRGFPHGRRRAEISPLGRMAAICASYEDMVNGGVGGRGINPAEAMAAMAAQAGAFDEPLLAAFTEALGIYPVGTVLLLGSRRLAMVVDQTSGDPTRPQVVTFFSTVSGHKLAPELVDLAEGGDAIDGLARPENYGIPDFPALREKLFAHAYMA